MGSKKLPKVSFIIPTLNAGMILHRCLTSIRNQQYPQKKIEIIIADGGSTDNTLEIAKSFGVKVISNPEILHEPGKSRAARVARGDILFYTDADNILADSAWLLRMTKPYMEESNIVGFLPQTVPPPNSNPINRYLGYLFTDPFTWFIYGKAANPLDYHTLYRPVKRTKDYLIYKFPPGNPPLFGLSQGVGTAKSFKRYGIGYSDDLLSGIKLILEGRLVAYVSSARVYHYHVESFWNFVKKYTWRIRNNIRQQVSGMGLVNRKKFFPLARKLRIYLFVPYALSLIFPTIDAVKLSFRFRDAVMLWHIPASLSLSLLIIKETTLFFINKDVSVGDYE